MKASENFNLKLKHVKKQPQKSDSKQKKEKKEHPFLSFEEARVEFLKSLLPNRGIVQV